jgi:hypothetical protein
MPSLPSCFPHTDIWIIRFKGEIAELGSVLFVTFIEVFFGLMLMGSIFLLSPIIFLNIACRLIYAILRDAKDAAVGLARAVRSKAKAATSPPKL